LVKSPRTQQSTGQAWDESSINYLKYSIKNIQGKVNNKAYNDKHQIKNKAQNSGLQLKKKEKQSQ